MVFPGLVGHLYFPIRDKTWERNWKVSWNGTLHEIFILRIFGLISVRDTNSISYYTDNKFLKINLKTLNEANIRMFVSNVNSSSTKLGTDFSSVLTSQYLQFWMLAYRRSIGSPQSWWSFQPEQGGYKHNLESSFFPVLRRKEQFNQTLHFMLTLILGNESNWYMHCFFLKWRANGSLLWKSGY